MPNAGTPRGHGAAPAPGAPILEFPVYGCLGVRPAGATAPQCDPGTQWPLGSITQPSSGRGPAPQWVPLGSIVQPSSGRRVETQALPLGSITQPASECRRRRWLPVGDVAGAPSQPVTAHRVSSHARAVETCWRTRGARAGASRWVRARGAAEAAAHQREPKRDASATAETTLRQVENGMDSSFRGGAPSPLQDGAAAASEMIDAMQRVKSSPSTQAVCTERPGEGSGQRR
jgi:hypothetical protein